MGTFQEDAVVEGYVDLSWSVLRNGGGMGVAGERGEANRGLDGTLEKSIENRSQQVVTAEKRVLNRVKIMRSIVARIGCKLTGASEGRTGKRHRGSE